MNKLLVGKIDATSSYRTFGAIITEDGSEILFNSNESLKNDDVVIFEVFSYHNKFLRANTIYSFKYFLDNVKYMIKTDRLNTLKMFDLFTSFYYSQKINFYISNNYLNYIDLFEIVKNHPIPYEILFKIHQELPLNLKKHLEKNINWKDNANMILEVINNDN